jgi:hypothetical protein
VAPLGCAVIGSVVLVGGPVGAVVAVGVGVALGERVGSCHRGASFGGAGMASGRYSRMIAAARMFKW